MGDSAFVHGNLDKILLSCLYTFRNGCSDLIGFAETPADHTVLVTYDNDGGEAECATTLGYFCNAVDGYKAVFQFQIICRLDSVISLCHDSNLKFKTCVAGCIGQ